MVVEEAEEAAGEEADGEEEVEAEEAEEAEEEAARPQARVRSRRPFPAPSPACARVSAQTTCARPWPSTLNDIRSPRNPASIGFSAVVMFGIDAVVTRE